MIDDSIKDALGNLVMTEDDTMSVSEYEMFLTKFSRYGFSIDFNFMNENKICNIPSNILQAFNECLIEMKIEDNVSLFSILTQLSIHLIEPSKIKSYINSEVKMLLVDELKHSYPKIKQMYPLTDELF